jgi:CRP-like cAMP-binding protein
MVERFERWAEQTLGAIWLFGGMDAEAVIELGDRAQWQRHPAGTTLIRKGETRHSVLALVAGSASTRFYDGRAPVTSEAGATLGLRCAFHDGPAWIMTVAATPVLVAELSVTDLLHAMATSPALATNVGRMLVARNHHRAPREQLDTQILKALMQAVGAGPDCTGVVPLAQPIDPALWATLLGVDRSDVERALVRLERHGIVLAPERGGRCVDLARLRERLR